MSAITTRNSRKRSMSPSNTKTFKSPQEMMPPPTLKRLKRTYNNSSKHNIMENTCAYFITRREIKSD